MYRHTTNTIFTCVLILSSVHYVASAATDSEFAQDTVVLKRLAKTPLIKGELYDDYVREDKALNSAYIALSKSLHSDDRIALKKAQRRWIKWRKDKCDAMQKKINCLSASCYGVTHDTCVVQMTLDRTLELRDFARNIAEGTKKQFDFSRRNKYLDDE